MTLHKNYKINKLREVASKIGRAGVSEQAIKAVKDFDGSYKGIMELAGKLLVIADASTFDEYWEGQVNRGIGKMTDCFLDIDNKEGK